MIFAYAVLSEASLSFLGVGAITTQIPSWGNILEEGRTFIRRAPWTDKLSGLVIVVCVLHLNLLGDGLRDILILKSEEAKLTTGEEDHERNIARSGQY